MIKSTTITAILKLVLAECRGSWQRLFFFMICIAIGVGAMMSVKSFSANVADSIDREAKSLIASDIEIRGSWPLTNEELSAVKQLADGQVLIQTVVELKAMALIDTIEKQPDSSMLVELKAVPKHYPYYGNVIVTPEIPFQELLQDNSALVEESFLLKNQLQTGDYFKLGEKRLRINGVIKREPDRGINIFNLGPRVMISLETLDKTELIQQGSRVRYRTQIKIPEGVEIKPLIKKLKNSFDNTGTTIKSYRQVQPVLQESIKRFELFLGSIGVIALLIGGVGIAMIARTFLKLKLTNVAILKCLGGQTTHIFSVYLLQAMLLGLMGSLLGIAGGFCLQWFIPTGISQYFNVSITPQWAWMPALEALSLGIITTFIFSLGPLLEVRRTPPARLLRQQDETDERYDISSESKSLKNKLRLKLKSYSTCYPDRFFSVLILVLGLLVITFWQAASLKAGLLFFSGIIGAIAILLSITLGIIKLLKKINRFKKLSIRYSLSNLYRPHSQATSIVTAIGVGVMLILTVQLIQYDLLDFINKSSPDDAPNFFFIDIQPDQAKRFQNIIKEIPAARLTGLIPIIRSKLYAVAGKPIKEMTIDNVRTKRFFNREFVLTYTDTLPEENTVIKGEWWGKSTKNIPGISIEIDAAKTLGVSLGSQLTLKIQSVPITATVTSIRKVNWNNRRTNFYMILSPGSLDSVPYNFVGTVQIPKKNELELQTLVVESLPNVTAINTRQIITAIQEVLNRISVLVRALSVFTIATGLVILSGAIASTKFRRMKEAAILKTIGATKKTIAAILGYEYMVLGFISGGVGSLLSIVFSYGIDEYLVRLDWKFRPVLIIIAIAVTVFIVWSVGILSSWKILNNKPLQTLRHNI